MPIKALINLLVLLSVASASANEKWNPKGTQTIWKKLEDTLCCTEPKGSDHWEIMQGMQFDSEMMGESKDRCAQECNDNYDEKMDGKDPSCDEWMQEKGYDKWSKGHQQAIRQQFCNSKNERDMTWGCNAVSVNPEYLPNDCLYCKAGKKIPMKGATCWERIDSHEGCLPYYSSSSLHGVCSIFEFSTFCADQVDDVPCLPGLEFLGKAFNIIKDNTDPDRLPQLQNPFLMKHTFQKVGKGYKRKEMGGKMYILTQEVKVTTMNTAKVGGSTETFSSVDEFSRKRAADLNVEGSYGIHSGSVAFEGGDAIKSSLSQNMQFTQLMNEYPKYSITATPDNGLSVEVGTWWNSFDQDTATPAILRQKAESFLDTFGTHMITEVTMGGRLTTQIQSDACSSKTEIETVAKAKACAATGKATWSVSGCAGVSQETESDNEASASSVSCNLQVEGGDISRCSAGGCREGMCDNDAWATSIGKDRLQYAPLSFQLTSWTSILRTVTKKHDWPILDAFDKLVKERLANKALKSVQSKCVQKLTEAPPLEELPATTSNVCSHKPLWVLAMLMLKLLVHPFFAAEAV